MEFSIQEKISNFVEQQFPSFYNEEGPNFILFVKAYYEWLEETGNPIAEGRQLFNYRDIDNTIENFLIFYQKKYLYGIPFNVIINKRYLLKHILDVYRSKSSIQGYKLLFRLIYNEDVDVYIPSDDMLRASDGIWKEPKYVEIYGGQNLSSLIGKRIVGASSRTKANVEDYTREIVNGKIISSFYLSNISPKGGIFAIGEYLHDEQDIDSDELDEILSRSPKVIGSLGNIEIINGGANFVVGDVLKIVHRDPETGNIVSEGIEGEAKVVSISRKLGAVSFSVANTGFGFIANNILNFIYNSPSDSTGEGAGYSPGTLSNIRQITYSTDCIADYLEETLDAVSYGLPANSSANLSSNIGTALKFTTDFFGSLATISNVQTGEGYTQPTINFVKTIYNSNTLTGTLTYNIHSSSITGTSTEFDKYLEANSVMYIQANSSVSGTREYVVVKNVVSNTSITLYSPPIHNSTPTASYKVSPEILKSNFAAYDEVVNYLEVPISNLSDLDANVFSLPFVGNSSVSNLSIFNSGKGYVEGEIVTLYRYSSVSQPTIVSGGVGYSNGEFLYFIGGDAFRQASGFVRTNSNGTITSVTMTTFGSSYKSVPYITINTTSGNGAMLSVNLEEFSTDYEVVGRTLKTGVGIQKGFWTTTDGFLNADKYVQDSYYYQDFSYEIKTGLTLDKYRDILYNTFHIAGTELFGRLLVSMTEALPITVVDISGNAGTVSYLTSDSATLTSDSIVISSDMTFTIS